MAPGRSPQAQEVLRAFAGRLKELRADAGSPTLAELVAAAKLPGAEVSRLSRSGISEVLEGRSGFFRLPNWSFVNAFVDACRIHDARTGGVLWRERTDVREWKLSHAALVKLIEASDGVAIPAVESAPGGPVLPLIPPPPPVPAGFTGRGEDLENLLTLLRPSPSARMSGPAAAGASEPPADGSSGAEASGSCEADSVPVVVTSVLGMGGMGKTTLALALAEAVRTQGLFTGVLFLDLHGYDDTVVDADQALDGALRALGTAPERIPPETDQRAALYRAQLAVRARAGERVLVVADNACGPGQVEHLVPGSGPHRLLVTSRDDFAAGLGARLVDLDVLDPGPAVALMETALRIPLAGDVRIAADPAGAARVAKLCGYLPLALQLAAAQLAADRVLTPSWLAQDLEDLGKRLDVLEDGPRAVRTVLERSYQRLSPAHAELFRLLAVNPGPDLSTDTAATLTGTSAGGLRKVRTGLVALSRASLVRQDPATGRWRMHDLVRAYASEQAAADPDRTSAALRQLLAYYTFTTQVAATYVDVDVTDSMEGRGQGFTSRAEALTWLDVERANLVGAVHIARTAGYHEIAQSLSSNLGPYLRLRRRLEDCLEVAETGLAAARDSRNPGREAGGWDDLGSALQSLRRFEEAEQAHRTALALYRDLGDRHGEACAWGNLGNTLRGLRRFEEAELAHHIAIGLYQNLGDRHRTAVVWANLALALQEMQRFDSAEQAHHIAIGLYQNLGDRHRAAEAWNSLGSTLRDMRRFEEAEQAHHIAIGLYQNLGDQPGAAGALDSLGSTLRDMRRFEEAEQAHHIAIGLYQNLGDQPGAAIAWNNLGITLRKAERVEQALEAGKRAVALFENLGDQYLLGEALDELTDTLLAAGRPVVEVRAMRERSAAAYRAADADDEAARVLEKTNE